jgi:hypothetical protein
MFLFHVLPLHSERKCTKVQNLSFVMCSGFQSLTRLHVAIEGSSISGRSF